MIHDTDKFHDLFREFLLNMLECDSLVAQYDDTGKYFFSKQDYSRALEYYLKSGSDDGVAISIYEMQNHNSGYAAVEDTLNIVRQTLNEAIVEKHPLSFGGFAMVRVRGRLCGRI